MTTDYIMAFTIASDCEIYSLIDISSQPKAIFLLRIVVDESNISYSITLELVRIDTSNVFTPGRPGGPAFYISTVDNSENHGPASQGSKTEADGCFGKIALGGPDEAVVNRMKKQPGKSPPSGFVSSPKDFIKITKMDLIRSPN